jgi:hypothetical protein
MLIHRVIWVLNQSEPQNWPVLLSDPYQLLLQTRKVQRISFLDGNPLNCTWENLSGLTSPRSILVVENQLLPAKYGKFQEPAPELPGFLPPDPGLALELSRLPDPEIDPLELLRKAAELGGMDNSGKVKT